MPKETELYELIGCAPDADDDALKRAFRKSALKWHPDRYSGASESEREAAEKKFAEINNAYDILKDPETRERYDRGGLKAVQEGEGGGGDGADLFSAMFGGGGRRREPKPKDIMHQIDVPLEQFYTGYTRKLAITRRRLCGACDGTGSKSKKETTCSDCGGRGARQAIRQLAPGFMQQMQVPCQACRGKGQVIDPSDVCGQCSGERVFEDRKVFEVVIDKGMKHGDAVTFADEGNQIPGVRKSGDVVILLAGQPHPRFVRKGRALLAAVTVSLVDALCGFQIQIQHLDERVLVINPLEGGQVLKPEMTCLVSREGMPVKGTGGTEKGDLVVRVTVDFPRTLSPDQCKKLRMVLGPMTTPTVPSTPAVEGSYETTMTECHSSLEDLAKEGKQHHDEDDDEGPQFVRMGGGGGGGGPCPGQ